jgi:hypothetical protein
MSHRGPAEQGLARSASLRFRSKNPARIPEEIGNEKGRNDAIGPCKRELKGVQGSEGGNRIGFRKGKGGEVIVE